MFRPEAEQDVEADGADHFGESLPDQLGKGQEEHEEDAVPDQLGVPAAVGRHGRHALERARATDRPCIRCGRGEAEDDDGTDRGQAAAGEEEVLQGVEAKVPQHGTEERLQQRRTEGDDERDREGARNRRRQHVERRAGEPEDGAAHDEEQRSDERSLPELEDLHQPGRGVDQDPAHVDGGDEDGKCGEDETAGRTGQSPEREGAGHRSGSARPSASARLARQPTRSRIRTGSIEPSVITPAMVSRDWNDSIMPTSPTWMPARPPSSPVKSARRMSGSITRSPFGRAGPMDGR